MRKFVFALILLLSAACSSGTASSVPSPTTAITTPLIPTATELPATSTPQAPPDWAGQGYTGQLILILYGENGNRLVDLDLASGKITTLFQAPANSWLAAAVVSPDDKQILLSYAPPTQSGETQFGYADLYTLPLDGSSPPQPFLTRKDPQESFFNPAWAPDGKSVYYTHLYRIDPNSKVPAFQNDIEQATVGGETKALIAHSLWPAISPDGSELSYLNEDPVTFSNDLYLANPDGSNPSPVLQPGLNPPVDDHLFTQDGQQIIFSMVNVQPAPASSWLDRLLGIEQASAHTVPSDWYISPVQGGTAQQLTNLGDVGMYGDLSPDGRQLVFISATGLHIMNLDGSDLYDLSNQVYIGTVDWIP
jgi:Tol biopolymer transport system component